MIDRPLQVYPEPACQQTGLSKDTLVLEQFYSAFLSVSAFQQLHFLYPKKCHGI
jgi:hypothetical protein